MAKDRRISAETVESTSKILVDQNTDSQSANYVEEVRIVDTDHDTTNTDFMDEAEYQKSQEEMHKRMQFGQTRERFENSPFEATLPFQADPVEREKFELKIKQQLEYIRNRPNHPGRAKVPEGLPVEVVEIYPKGDL